MADFGDLTRANETTDFTLTQSEHWVIPCYLIEAGKNLDQPITVLTRRSKQKSEKLSVTIGVGANTNEILYLGNKYGGIVLALDYDNPYDPPFPIRDINLTKRPFEVYLLNYNASFLPDSFADNVICVGPQPAKLKIPIEKALSSLKKGGSFLFVLFDLNTDAIEWVESAAEKVGTVNLLTMNETEYVSNRNLPQTFHLSAGGIRRVTIVGGYKK